MQWPLTLSSFPLRRGIWLILLGAACLRFYALNWDQGTLSHPDERHVLMAANRLSWPASVREYLNESASPLNPRNRETPYFAYGTAPTTALTAVCTIASVKLPEQQTLVARGMSALADLAAAGLVFLIARRLRGGAPDDRTGLLAATLYSACALPIQHAHFFVVDPFANAFVMLALWLQQGAQRRDRAWEYAGAGAALGLAVACKISVATLALPLCAGALIRSEIRDRESALAPLRTIVARVLFLGAAAAVTFRLAEPDAFVGLFALAPRWLANMHEVIGVTQGTSDMPFTRQWVGRAKLLFPWLNMVVWGMGVPLGIAAWLGFVWAAWRALRREYALIPLVSWIALVFVHQGTQWLMTMRYFLPIYGPLTILAAAWLVQLPRWRWGISIFVCLFTIFWGVAYLGVYRPEHTRVQASRWIYNHIPAGATLGVEQWDDSLPLALPKWPDVNSYHYAELGWYDPDTPAKRSLVLHQLDTADYLILASDKLYGSIPRMPYRYPMTIAYYKALFNGSLGFDLVAQFRGEMGFFRLHWPTDSAEEAFSVYDHPRVMIFKKTSRYSLETTGALLGGIDLSHAVDSRAPPREQSAILLKPARWAQQLTGGTWSDIFHRDSLVNRQPLACWVALMILLLAIAFPYAFTLFGALPDRGAGLCRLMAISVPLWLLWVLGSLEWMTFRAAHWRLLMLLAAAGAAFIYVRRRKQMQTFAREQWRPLIAGEACFWAAFGLCLFIRWRNPDLWHPSWGGEKPMEMTYLYGVMRSDYFPPYNPWYAGGFINYYYFGFVLTGGLIKGMGLLPEVGFNLCLATFYALTASAAFTAARALTIRTPSLWPAIAGTTFVTLCGNLFQAKYIYERLVRLGQDDHQLTIPIVSNAIRAFAGYRRWMHGARLFTYDADPYWVAARAIPVTKPDSVQPITEFPFWSYLYADLHPHLIALPFTLAVVAALAAWCLENRFSRKAGLAVALAFLLGLFWPTNTWDWPTYGALTGLTLFACCWSASPKTPRGFAGAMLKSLALFIAILIGARLAFLPFYHHYVAGYGSFSLWQGERTSIPAYLYIYGFPLAVLAAAYSIWWRRRMDAEGPLRACQAWMLLLRQRVPGGSRSLREGLTQRFERRKLSAAFALMALTVAVVLIVWLLADHALAALLGLGLLAALILAASRASQPLSALPFLMAALAFALSILVEYVVLDGDVGRMNTVFKFYYQVWVLFALAAACCLPELLVKKRLVRRWPLLAALALLFALTLVYPVTAVPTKISDRFVKIPPTLDGLAYMKSARYQIHNRDFALRGDLGAIRWLQDHVLGTPVLLEMNTGSTLYAWGNRISINTGLPAVIGWEWHERQQQAGLTKIEVPERIADVQTIYNTRSPDTARKLIDKYGVGLVIVGELERAFTSAAGIEKFAGMDLEQIYDADGTAIYRVPWRKPTVQLR